MSQVPWYVRAQYMYHEKLYFSELSLHTATRETWILVERAPFSGLFLRSHTHTESAGPSLESVESREQRGIQPVPARVVKMDVKVDQLVVNTAVKVALEDGQRLRRVGQRWRRAGALAVRAQ